MDAGAVGIQERIAERYARTDTAQARRQLAFLAEASDVLAESLDYETTLSSVAGLVVPELADWCSVDILEEGILWPVLMRHLDPQKMALASELRHRYPASQHAAIWEVLRTGRARLCARLTEEVLSQWAPEPEQQEIARRLAWHSCMLVPLKARGRVLGVLGFMSAESGAEYDESDLAMAEELAGRCALALDNALLHSQLKQALVQKEEGLQERERLLRALELERHRLDTVLQRMPAGVVMVEAGTGRVLVANPRAEQILGRRIVAGSLESPDAYRGYRGDRPDGTEYALESWPLVGPVREGEAAHGEEIVLTRPDGTRLRLLMSAIPLKDDEGRVVAAVGTCEDITALRAAEEDALRHARFMEQFIGVLGHDLRNPLQAIRGSAQLVLRRQDLDDALRRTVARMSGAADRMGRMITDLLDYTRTRLGGGIPLTAGEVCLPGLAREILEELEVANPGRAIELRASDEGRGQWDRDRIAQVIQNLVSNALQYGPKDEPILVTVRDEPEHVVFSVHNDGEPISADVMSRLFEPFRRGERPASEGTRSDGLGLGLYIARQIVAAHGGDIEVRSSEEEGTTFTVRLPRRLSEAEAELTPS